VRWQTTLASMFGTVELLDNYAILKGLHKRGVHMLSFSNNDEYLITCGMTRPSAVIIYDWKT
jgi:hypothetical protein